MVILLQMGNSTLSQAVPFYRPLFIYIRIWQHPPLESNSSFFGEVWVLPNKERTMSSVNLSEMELHNARLVSTGQIPAALDLRVEEFLFQSYIREQARAERYLAERDAARELCAWLQKSLTKRRAFAKIKRLTVLKPVPGEKK